MTGHFDVSVSVRLIVAPFVALPFSQCLRLDLSKGGFQRSPQLASRQSGVDQIGDNGVESPPAIASFLRVV